MGIYNPFAHMPRTCDACDNYHKELCPLCEDFRGFMESRHPKCPLVEIRAPHGKLVDVVLIEMQIKCAKEACENESKDFCNAFRDQDGELSTQWWCVEDMLENAPAAIEEETGNA